MGFNLINSIVLKLKYDDFDVIFENMKNWQLFRKWRKKIKLFDMSVKNKKQYPVATEIHGKNNRTNYILLFEQDAGFLFATKMEYFFVDIFTPDSLASSRTIIKPPCQWRINFLLDNCFHDLFLRFHFIIL